MTAEVRLGVNRVDSVMSATRPLTPQLLPNWCGAASDAMCHVWTTSRYRDRLSWPFACPAPRIVAAPSATTSMAPTCRWRSRPLHQKRKIAQDWTGTDDSNQVRG